MKEIKIALTTEEIRYISLALRVAQEYGPPRYMERLEDGRRFGKVHLDVAAKLGEAERIAELLPANSIGDMCPY